MKPNLTIIVTVRDNQVGWWNTIQSIRLQNDCRQIEFITATMAPDAGGANFYKVMSGRSKLGANVGAMSVTAWDGSAAPREIAIQAAQTDVVMCVDSPMQIHPGVITRLRKWHDEHPDSRSIVGGVLVGDDLQSIATHMVDRWAGPRWGVPANVWEQPDGTRISVFPQADGTTAYTGEGPECQFVHHFDTLMANGWRPLGYSPNDEFEIPAQGLEFFSFRKAHWPGFHPKFTGFAGAEFYLHDKFCTACGKAVCLGFARYSPMSASRIPNGELWGNYILGHQEQGRSLDRMREHLLAEKHITQEKWDKLLADPASVMPAPPPRTQPVRPKGGPGTELREIFKSIRIEQKEAAEQKDGCGGCEAKMNQMDMWGVEGCRANYWTIVGFLKDGMVNFSKWDSAKAMAWAATNGLAWKMDSWSEPFEALVKLAIDRAEQCTPSA
jgi:hypothetical protein